MLNILQLGQKKCNVMQIAFVNINLGHENFDLGYVHTNTFSFGFVFGDIENAFHTF